MKQLFLSVALIMCCSASGFAKNKKEATQQDAATTKEKVELATQNLTDRMESQLEGKKSKKVSELKNDHEQFLFMDSKIDDLLKTKSHGLNDVYKKLRKDYNPSAFTVDGHKFNIGAIKPQIEYKKKKNRIDTIVKSDVIVPVTFQTRTIAKDNVSDARFEVSMEWSLNPNKKNSKPKLVAVKSTPIELTNSEIALIRSTAKSAIADWYKKLPSNLDKKYTANALDKTQPMTVSPNQITINGPIKRHLTVNAVPEITIQLNPTAFINPDSLVYYTNPTAFIVLKPEFDITIDNSLKNATINSVSYRETLSTPVPDAVKSERISKATTEVQSFFNNLSSYVSRPTDDGKEMIESMFTSPENQVAVSNLTRNGKETIEQRAAKGYLKRVRGNGLNISSFALLDEVNTAKLNANNSDLNIPFDNNFNTIVFLVEQHYESAGYKDITSKAVILENTDGNYKVNRIIVIPGSTRLIN